MITYPTITSSRGIVQNLYLEPETPITDDGMSEARVVLYNRIQGVEDPSDFTFSYAYDIINSTQSHMKYNYQ